MTAEQKKALKSRRLQIGKEVIEPLSQRIAADFVTEAVVHPEIGEVRC